MRRRSLSDLVDLMHPLGVELVGDDMIVGPDVVLDNRQATQGSLFCCFAGSRVDGHQFAPQAVEAGAAAVMGNFVTDADAPHLLVPDTVEALSALARGIVREERERGLISIGITGSSGKTSTKDLVAQVLESVGPTVAPAGSHNNEIGVPLTACRVDAKTRFLVSEMGARGLGHIEWLTSLVTLDIGAVLNIGQAHVGEFGDVATTARAKSEIVAGLDADGWAVLNADDPAVAAMRDATNARIAWFGENPTSEGDLIVTVRNVTMNSAAQHSFDLVLIRDGEETATHVDLHVVGRSSVANAMAATAICAAAGLSLDQIAPALSRATRRSAWRMELHQRDDNVLVLNDAYNANPDSVAAALRTAAELGQFQKTTFPEARVIAVLGDMLELGSTASEAHVAIGRLAADLNVSEVIAVGEHADEIRQGAGEEGMISRVSERDDVAASLQLGPGDVVLIKGSRGIGLESVAQELTAGEGESS